MTSLWSDGKRLRALVGASLVALGISLLPGGAAARAAAGPGPAANSIGLFDPSSGLWYLRDATGHTTRLSFGRQGDIPLIGDWDGDGIDTPALYRREEGRLLVRGSRDEISLVYVLPAGGMPVVADTDGDGRDTVSLARGGRLYVVDGLGRGPAELSGPDPLPLALPDGTDGLVGGDFDGDGVDEVAALHNGRVDLVGPVPGPSLGYLGGALAVAGDWDGDGVHTMGVYDPWRAQFRLYGAAGAAAATIPYGATGMLPVAGTFGELPGRDTPPPHRAGLPPMRQGDSGPQVALLQRELAARRLYRGEIDGEFGPATAYAVVTFHKLLGVERSWEWEASDSLRMARFILPPLPDRPDEPDRIEVDVGRQVLYLFQDGEVAQVFPVSTASGNLYYSVRSGGMVRSHTPHGDFALTRFSRGWTCDWVTGWCIYNAWNFTTMYALHGYGSVPAYPASHGCVRIPNWEADWLASRLFVGMPFHVWDEFRPPTRR